MYSKSKGLGMFNLHGNRENKKVLSCTMNPFGSYYQIIEKIETFNYKSITFLGETFPIKTPKQIQEVKIYLHRFIEIVKYDFTKETRPPMRFRVWMKEERFEIVFDFDSPIIGWEEQEYIKELEKENEELKKQLNATE
jgi:hypothetical protein